MTKAVHDVLIIGAGPAGLAVAARLREPTPSAIFTDSEHNRYQWIKKYSGRMNLRPRGQNRETPKCSSTSRRNAANRNDLTEADKHYDIKVLDGSGSGWLHRWKENFAALGISHLRSPMFFHPCPRDRDGLLAFAQETGRCHHCVEIAGCIGKSMSKHRRKKKTAKGQSVGTGILEIDERDRKDYFTPSAKIFEEYCGDVVQRYSLEDVVDQTQVVLIHFDEDDTGIKLFKVNTTSGTKLARVVVLAVGAGGKPVMPRQLSIAEQDGACHSTQLAKDVFLPKHLTQKICARAPTAVVIVGGGLTGAQLASKCIESGVRRVFLVMRSDLKLKPFDVDLVWMAKYRNMEKAAFWIADSDEERLQMLLKARNGGSIPPRFFKKLQTYIAIGALSIHTHTTIQSQVWDGQRKTWDIETCPPILDLPRQVDYIYYATGVAPDVERLPILSAIHDKFPIDVKGGMPCLTEDLAWAKDVPLFVAGRLAGLRIGPDCGNLEGARAGAERIAWAVEELLEKQDGVEGEDSYHRLCQRMGCANMYESLNGCDSEEYT